jgi:hypothetical protein
MRNTARAFGIALVHLMLTVGLFVVSAGSTMGAHDLGTPPSLVGRAASSGVTLLLLPLALPVSSWLTGPAVAGFWSYVILGLNSLVWGFATMYLVRWWRRRSHRTRESHRLVR